jgi:lipopolysaccharide export system protein LptA
MLSGDEPLQAIAARMDSKNRNRNIHYDGNVLMWQGANRIQAQTVDLDREKRTLIANGSVVTNLWEEPKEAADKAKKSASPVMTEVRAPHLIYTEADRLAYYSGGSELKRPNLHVKAREIRAFLSDSKDNSDSQLEKAIADGSVTIFQTSPDRTRTGTAEHSEYYTDEQKIILKGGLPKLVDTRSGTTAGPEGLTYWADDDRLLVNGSKDQPVQTRIRQRKK